MKAMIFQIWAQIILGGKCFHGNVAPVLKLIWFQ